MARQRVKNKDLAEVLNVHPNAVSYLKNQDSMPRINGETLNRLCKYLDCTPADLIEYVADADDEELAPFS